MSELLEVLFLFFALTTLILIIVLVCMHLYEIFEEPAIQKRMRQLRKPTQPWVTVLLYARNNETTIEASLHALLRSYYHHYDIVVIDETSNKETFRKMQSFLKTHPHSPVSYLHRHVHRSAKESLIAGYRKSKKGDVVISLLADTIVPRSFLKRAVAVKQDRTRVSLKVKESIATDSLSGIIHALQSVAWQRAHKAQVTNARNITVAKQPLRVEFASVFILLAIVITSLLIHETIIFWYSWLIITAYIGSVIWLNEEKIKTKLKLSFSAISALFLLPVASIVMAFSQVRSRN